MLWLVPSALAADLVFAVLGDPQTDGQHRSINWDVFPALVESAEAHGASMLLVAGDLVAGGGTPAQTAAQWADFNTAIAGFPGEVYMVPGNHDMYGGTGSFAAWRETFPWLPTDDSPPGEEGVSYYVDVGRTRIVFVTSDHEDADGRVSSAGLAWLAEVLSARDDYDHVFVLTHHPVTFSQDNSLGGVDGDFWQLLVSYGVTGLFTGHWHRYQPSQPGGGGATWETIIGTGGGWQGYAPIRPYQQQPGLLLVSVTGARADAAFIVDADGDGSYDDTADAYTLAWDTPPPQGLRARYTFEDGAQDSAPAPLGRGVHGALRGDARVADGALLLDGDGDSVEAGAIGDYVLAITGPVTVSLHARVDGVGSDPDYGSVLACYGTGDYYTEDEETNYAWYLSLREDGALVAFWEHGEGSNVYTAAQAAPQLLDGAWHHVAMTRSEDAVAFWVDGEPLGAPIAHGQLPTGGGRGMLYLGADIPAYPGYDLAGAIDEVCVYDLALDGDQIARLAARDDCDTLGEDDTPTDTDTDGDGDTDSDADTGEHDGEPAGSGAVPSSCGCRGGAAGLVWVGLLLGLRRRSGEQAPGEGA